MKIIKLIFLIFVGVFLITSCGHNYEKSEKFYKNGLELYKAKKYYEAGKILKKSVRACKTNWSAVHLLGKAYTADNTKNRYLKAVEILELMKYDNPEYYKTHKVKEDVAEAYFKAGWSNFLYGLKLQPTKFYGVYFRRAVEYNTNSPKLLFFDKYTVELNAYKYAKQFSNISKIDLQITISRYYEIIKRFSYYWPPYYRMGYYYLNYKKQPKKALQYLEKSYKQWSKKKETDEVDRLAFDMLYTLSQCYSNLGYKQKSNIYKKKALKLNPYADKFYEFYYRLFQFDKIKKKQTQH